MVKAGVIDFAVTGDWTPVAADCKISKDGGNVANTTNLVTAIGGAGSALWKLTLTATEMQAARVTIQIVDSATKAVEDQAIVIATYGNASAQHAFDFDLAEQLVALSAQGKLDVNAEADTALTDYDPPTGAELVSEIDAVQADIAALNDPTDLEIASAILKRDVDQDEASAAKHSLLTAVLGAVSKIEDDGAGNIKIYRTDGTTLHLTRAVTVDAALDPVKTLGVGT